VLLNFRHRVLFVRPAKVGGTSIEMFLQGLFWPSEPVEHEQSRKVFRDGLVTARMQPKAAPTTVERIKSRCWQLRYPHLTGMKSVNIEHLYNHVPPKKLKAALGERLWGNLFRVTVVRNPYDVEVSRFFWRNRFRLPPDLGAGRKEFEAFVQSVGPARTNVAVIDSIEEFDMVIDFTRIKSDLDFLVDRLELDHNHKPALPQEKSGLRPGWASDYRDLYTPQSKAVVTRKYEPQIEKMGYNF